MSAGAQTQPSSSSSVRLTATNDAVQGAISALTAQRDRPATQSQRMRNIQTLQDNYWKVFSDVLAAAAANAGAELEFGVDERLLVDLGVLNPRLLGDTWEASAKELQAELGQRGVSGAYYLSEWLNWRGQQLRLESDIGANDQGNFASQMREARKKVLARLTPILSGLPGVPLEVSEAMRSGDLDNAVLNAGIAAMRTPCRQTFLRRRGLWQMREQALVKARARAGAADTQRLLELLNELYCRDWRERHELLLQSGRQQEAVAAEEQPAKRDPGADGVVREAREISLRCLLMAAMENRLPDPVMVGMHPRVTKAALPSFIALAQTFDRSLVDMPPIVLVPGSGRGFFAWEIGCLLLAVRPLVSVEDSAATALAWMRIIDDTLNRNQTLQRAYEKRFPGAVFANDFPADYRAWLTRMARGDLKAMHDDRRGFFRDFIGPDVSKPLLPPNLRNAPAATVSIICRRLEKQLSSGSGTAALHRRLAGLYWQQNNFEAAEQQFNEAVRLAPDDGETLFSVGMFMRAQSNTEAARGYFKFGVERAADSLWGLYAKDALDNLI